MSLDFRDIDTRLKAAAFLEELNALLEKHGVDIDCSGYECDGLELEFRSPRKYSLPDRIPTDWTQHSVTLKEEW